MWAISISMAGLKPTDGNVRSTISMWVIIVHEYDGAIVFVTARMPFNDGVLRRTVALYTTFGRIVIYTLVYIMKRFI